MEKKRRMSHRVKRTSRKEGAKEERDGREEWREGNGVADGTFDTRHTSGIQSPQ